MLNSLRIKNVALISDLSLSFENGFTVLIGETGAGKSIILDSLSFVLGGKADKTLVRSGEKLMKVEALFSDINNSTKDLLTEQGIEADSEIVISRSLNIDGRGECRINGSIVLVSTLKQIALNLIDSYAQHDSQVLLSSKNHQAVLDGCASGKIDKIKNELETLVSKRNEIKKKIDEISGEGFTFERKKDFLTFQITEIESVKPQKGEDETLQEKRQMYLNFEKNADSLKEMLNIFEGDGTGLMSAKATQLKKLISSFSSQSKAFEELGTRMENVAYELSDIYETVKDFERNYVFDEKEFNEIDSRYDKIKNLKQKYGPTLDDVISFYNKSKTQLEDLDNSEYLLTKLNEDKVAILKQIYEKAKALSQERRIVAGNIEAQMHGELTELGMKHATFKVKFSESSEFSEETEIGKNGIDNVEFLFSANKGEELKSLSKTISGGELSRFMLAFKNIISGDGVQILVFDEIDSGISGETAMVVAEKLGMLSKKYQVLCITHLPQVASMADNYLYVKKIVKENSTFTTVEPLVAERTIEEIARLSSGAIVSESALLHAKELKNWAENYKNNL
ncbi:MAG: DNA repair protein RecN [Clostridia bacterium]